jgi:hypothetical protein
MYAASLVLPGTLLVLVGESLQQPKHRPLRCTLLLQMLLLLLLLCSPLGVPVLFT